jgi:hypothetical protein
MQVSVQIVIESECTTAPMVEEITLLVRDDLEPETLGLTLAESKAILAGIQEKMAEVQAEEYVEQQRLCSDCGEHQPRKDTKEIIYRTPFGKLSLESPRLYRCNCHPHEKASFSPLADLLPERTSPELLYLQTKWASLMSYGMSVKLLEEVLPLETCPGTVFNHVHQMAERVENELGDEQGVFADGCLRDWAALPRPDGPITVGIDGCHVHERDEESRKAGTFEVIVGKSIPYEGKPKRFGFVNTYDEKPKRRLFEVLQSQGMQMNQKVIFLSDGGDTVRELQLYLNPQAEHLLDWFHVTMRITNLRQMVKGLQPDDYLDPDDIDAQLERVKWYLWHGNVFRALQVLNFIETDFVEHEDALSRPGKIWKAVCDFQNYITANRAFIPNYGDRYRYGETISTAFVESTVNHVVSKRFVKKQQMRWTRRGAHLLLQVRVHVMNDEWRDIFCRWYPGMAPDELAEEMELAA